jgi:hemerythrin
MSKSEDHLTLNNKMNKVLNELLEHQYKEEVLMEKVKYPALEEHNSNHRMLYELFSSIEEPVIKSHIPPPIAAEILNRCLALHILLEDNKLVDFLIMHHPEIL